MSNKGKMEDAVESKEGIDIKKVTFDENGEVIGLDDTVLGDIAAGGQMVNDGCTVNNTGC